MSNEPCNCGCNAPEVEKSEECNCGCATSQEQKEHAAK